MVKIQINGITIKVYAAHEGVTTAMLDGLHDKYRITLKTEGDEKRFTYHNSIAHLGRPLSEEDIIGAVDCIVSDAYSYLNSRDLYDFADEFGYDYDSAGLRRVYNGCRRAYEKLMDLLESEENLSAMEEMVREY